VSEKQEAGQSPREPPPLLVDPFRVPTQELVDLGIDRRLKHRLSPRANQFIQGAASLEVRPERQHLGIRLAILADIASVSDW
jgi:hypothetical protein